MWKTNLAVQILLESHGELVAAVGECLLTQGALNLKHLVYTTKLKPAKIKKALQTLIQHGMVEYMQNNRNMIEYKIYLERVIYQVYIGQEVQCARILYGDAAEMIIEELQQEGRLPLHTLVDTVTNKLNEAIKAQGADIKEIQPSYVHEKFERMVLTNFIKRCSVPVKNEKGRIVGLEPPSPKLMFTVPPRSAAGQTAKVKQERDEGEPAAKRRRISQDAPQQGSSDDTATIYWEVNHPRFLHHFRDQLLVSAVANTLDSEKAAEIMRTILRLCERTTNPNAHTTMPVSVNEILSQLPKDKAITRGSVEQWLKFMTDSMPEFISKVGEGGAGMYTVNTLKAMMSLCVAHIESVVEERLGPYARRIVKIIIKNGRLEPDAVGKLALVAPKQCRSLLFSLYQEDFIYTSELSKAADFEASRTFFIFSVNVKRVADMLLDNGYKALNNIKVSRQHMLSDAKRLLEKQERIEAITLSLGLPASVASGEEADLEGLEMDEEKKEQLDAIMETMTPADRQQLKKVKVVTQYSEVGEQDLVRSVIFLLESYLALTFNPRPPKRVRNLLE